MPLGLILRPGPPQAVHLLAEEQPPQSAVFGRLNRWLSTEPWGQPPLQPLQGSIFHLLSKSLTLRTSKLTGPLPGRHRRLRQQPREDAAPRMILRPPCERSFSARQLNSPTMLLLRASRSQKEVKGRIIANKSVIDWAVVRGKRSVKLSQTGLDTFSMDN